MKYLSDFRIPAFALISAISLATILVTEFLQNHLLESQNDKLKNEAQKDLAVIRSNLEAQIYSDIYYANSLATLVSVNPDSTISQWKLIAEKLFSKSKNLRNIGIAPNDIIEFVYPLKGNEQALGLDFRTVPNQWRTIQLSRESKSIYLDGPIKLVQGGLGLIARNPIFIDPPYNTKYWGSCSVVLDVNSLFANSGVSQVEKKYQFAMRGVDASGKSGEVFYGDSAVFDNVIAFDSVNLISGSWYMAVSRDGLSQTLPWYQLYSARLIGYPTLVIIIILFSVIYYLYRIAHANSLQDELTKLPNRRFFIHSLEQKMQESNAKDRRFSLLNLDLNNFKSINDTYGHTVGDELLISVAKTVTKVIKNDGIVARVGGDEFLILLFNLTEVDRIKRVIQILKTELSRRPIKAGQDSITPEASIGYTINLNSGFDIDELLHAADINMYADKLKQKKSRL